MPACIDCLWRNGEECAAPAFLSKRLLQEITPIRRCAGAIMLHDFSLFQSSPMFLKNNKMIELGCGRGYHKITKRICDMMGIGWQGVDRLAHSGERKYLHRSKIEKMPFPDNTFGAAFSIHSVEHWGQSLSNYTKSIKEIHRVLAPGGKCYTIAPIWAIGHGHEIFQNGDIDFILSLFDPCLWGDVSFEEWRKDYSPLIPYNISVGASKSEWNINIFATKI